MASAPRLLKLVGKTALSSSSVMIGNLTTGVFAISNSISFSLQTFGSKIVRRTHPRS
jgi:hypothetical protein